MEAFLFDLATLEEFYTRCIKANAVTVESKNVVLLQLLAEKKIEHLGHTDKSAPELATELIKQGIKAKSVGFKAKKPLTKDEE